MRGDWVPRGRDAAAVLSTWGNCREGDSVRAGLPLSRVRERGVFLPRRGEGSIYHAGVLEAGARLTAWNSGFGPAPIFGPLIPAFQQLPKTGEGEDRAQGVLIDWGNCREGDSVRAGPPLSRLRERPGEGFMTPGCWKRGRA